MSQAQWYGWSDVDLPEWIDEPQASVIVSFLNSYIPRKYSTRGTRYHLLNRYPNGRLYLHLLNAPEVSSDAARITSTLQDIYAGSAS